MAEFETKDSGKRIDLANGMVRDTTEGKADYTLLLDGPLFNRWAELLSRGAQKYGKRNWCKALKSTDKAAREETKARFKESAFRHMMQWLQGDRSEDHAAAVLFNLNGYEAMLDTDHIALKVYDPKNVQVSFNGVPLAGFMPADSVKVYRSEGAPDPMKREIGNGYDKKQVDELDKEIEQGFGQSAYAPGMEPR